MATSVNRPFLQNLYSSATTNGNAVAPTPAQLLTGEIAINVNRNDPTMFVLDSNNQIRKFNQFEKDAQYDSLTAGTATEAYDLIGSSNDRSTSSLRYNIRTTAGDMDVMSSEPMALVDVKTDLDANNEPWNGNGLRFNGFNALIPDQVLAGYTVSGGNVTANSGYKIAYFKCVKGEWGTYGQSTKNNGYLFTKSDGSRATDLSGVYECATIPAAGSSVSGVSTTAHTNEDGVTYTYYLPANSGDYLCVVVPSSYNLNGLCAHIAWSNKDDDKYEVRSASVIDLTAIINRMNAGVTAYKSWPRWLGGVDRGVTGEDYVCDQITIQPASKADVATSYVAIKRINTKALSGLTWSVEEIPSTGESQTTTYKFSAPISDMVENSRFKAQFNGLVIEDHNVTYTTTQISTVPSFIAALGSSYIFYEWNTPKTYTGTVVGTRYGNDMGTEEVLGTDKASALITTSYVIALKDYLRGLPSEIAEYMDVIANHVVEVENEISVLKENLGEVNVNSVSFPELQNNIKSGSYRFYSEGHGTPWSWSSSNQSKGLVETRGAAPCKFAEYLDVDSGILYKCVDPTAAIGASQWRVQNWDAKADKVAGATNGHLAKLDSNGNLTDSGIATSNVQTVSNKVTSLSPSSTDVEYPSAKAVYTEIYRSTGLVVEKIYSSTSAMNTDLSPVSDITGAAIAAGQLVAISSSDSDDGSIYRYNGANASIKWSIVSKVGNTTPIDNLNSTSTVYPLSANQGKVLNEKVSQLGQDVFISNIGLKNTLYENGLLLKGGETNNFFNYRTSTPILRRLVAGNVTIEKTTPPYGIMFLLTSNLDVTKKYYWNRFDGESHSWLNYIVTMSCNGEIADNVIVTRGSYNEGSYQGNQVTFAQGDTHLYLYFSLMDTVTSINDAIVKVMEILSTLCVKDSSGYFTEYVDYYTRVSDLDFSPNDSGKTLVVNNTGKAVPQTVNIDTLGGLHSNLGPDNAGKILYVGDNGGIIPANYTPQGIIEGAVQFHETTTLYLGVDVLPGSSVNLGTGWSGNLTSGFTHTSGNTDILEILYNTTSGKKYLVEFILGAASEASIYAAIGNGPNVAVYNGTTTPKVGFVADGGTLKITPDSGFASSVKVTMKEIVEEGQEDSTCVLGVENVNHGQMVNNVSGFWNVAIGSENTFKNNENGSRNIAIGRNALANFKSGTRNVGIGTFSMSRLETGEHNVAIGSDSLWFIKRAADNIAIGYGAFLQMPQGAEFDAYRNIAIGSDTMSGARVSSYDNIAIGYMSGTRGSSIISPEKNVAIGNNAGRWAKKESVAVGHNAGYFSNGEKNIAIGCDAGALNNTPQDNSISIGYGVKTTKSNQVVIGNAEHTEFVFGIKKLVFNNDNTVTWETISLS